MEGNEVCRALGPHYADPEASYSKPFVCKSLVHFLERMLKMSM